MEASSAGPEWIGREWEKGRGCGRRGTGTGVGLRVSETGYEDGSRRNGVGRRVYRVLMNMSANTQNMLN